MQVAGGRGGAARGTRLIGLFLLAALPAGCRTDQRSGQRPSDPASEANAPDLMNRVPDPPDRSTPDPPMADSLRLRLEIPDSVPRGRVVPISFRIENVSGRTLDLYLRGRTIAFDVIVRRSDGSRVWRRLENEVLPAILRLESVPAGGAIELQATWDQRSNAGDRVPAGEYTIEAELLTESAPLRSPATMLTITAG